MSTTNKIVEELYALPMNKSCCKKAFICGLLYGARSDGFGKYTASFYRESDACFAAEQLDKRFSSGEKALISPISRGGHKAYELKFFSKSICSVLLDIDLHASKELGDIIGFRCADCAVAFLRGAFISSASLSHPKSGYHLEISVINETRAELLCKLLAEYMPAPGKIKRQNGIGLYYKSNARITDLLNVLGAATAGFDMLDFYIERDIRNRENRATNCVTHNISRAVGANRKYIEAIELLQRANKLSGLSEELQYTAELRLENDSASLSELAMLHNPPITKSGLNGRLKKLLELAQDLDKDRHL